MRLNISHTTEYHYNEPVTLGLQRLRLRPNAHRSQDILEWNIVADGARDELQYQDQYGNQIDVLKLAPQTEHVKITVTGVVETHDVHGIYGHDSKPLPAWFYKQSTHSTEAGRQLKKLAKKHENNDGSVAFFHDLMNEIRDHVAYKIGETDVDTTAEDAWVQKKGVCQDHSHIMIATARLLGHQARYVSGYLLIDGVTDQEAAHAWCEVNLDGLGWVGFDVSNGYSPDERYVRLAVGRDYHDAAPIHGLRYGNAQETLDVHLQIQQ